MNRLLLAAILFFCLLTYYTANNLYIIRSDAPKRTISNLALLPPEIAELTTLEFPGLASAYIFLQTLTYLGESSLEKQTITQEDYKKVYRALLQASVLDPRATDTFILAETTLPFEAGMVEEANEILAIAARGRPKDYRPNLYLWYNHYYLMNSNEKSLSYLKKAATLSTAPQYVPLLAARLQMQAGNFEAGILFVSQLLQDTTTPYLKKSLKTRLVALKKIYFLETKVKEFRNTFGRYPQSLNEIVKLGLLRAIPDDPYGGVFYLMDNNRVYSSSKLTHKKKDKKTSQ